MKILLNNYSIIQNSLMKNYNSVFLVKSKLTISFLNVLLREGVIRGYNISNSFYRIEVFLRYNKGISVLGKIKPISTCSRSIYYSLKDIYGWRRDNYSSHHCFLILSTSKNLISSNEVKNYKVGGKVLCVIS